MTKLVPKFFCPYPIRDQGEIESDDNEIKLNLTGYRQTTDVSCGASAAWPIVQEFSPKIGFQQFFRMTKCDSDGIDDDELARALRKCGIGVSIRFGLTQKEIYDTINKGYPILTGIMHGKSEDDERIPHWVLIFGVSPEKIYTMNNYILGAHGRAEFTWDQWEEIVDKESNFLTCWGK